LVVMIGVDMLWLGVIAKRMYQDGIGHLMADRPNWVAGALFYPVFAAGLMVFAVVPNEDTEPWTKTLISGALFGFFAYATYDLTNLATLKSWPWRLSAVDLAWGTVVSGTSALIGSIVMKHFAHR
jgi:uncharacterized membrane protein